MKGGRGEFGDTWFKKNRGKVVNEGGENERERRGAVEGGEEN